MRFLATPVALVLALALAAPSAAQTASSQTITTSTVVTKVFNNGILQGDCAATPLFTFNGTEAGCGGGFLLGISSSNVIGDAYLLDQNTGWTPVAIGASTVFPYPTLTSGVETTFTNATNGVSVVANHYTGTANPDYVVHHYVITNTGASALTDVYPGLFWDWDVAGAAAAANTAAYNATEQLIYVNSPANPTLPFFGTAALTGTVSGYRYDMPYPTGTPATHARSDLYTGLTVSQGTTSPARDQRGVIGVGPYDIPAGESITVVFASLGGTNAADVIANAADAHSAVAAGPPVHDTGVVTLDLLDDGFIGTDLGVGGGFTFNGTNALFEGQLIVARSATQISGSPYSSDPSGAGPQWSTTSAPSGVPPPVGFNQAFQTDFDDSPPGGGIGLAVTQRSLSDAGDPYVIVEYTVHNTTAGTLDPIYVGLFTDWDVSATATADRGGYDATNRLLYAFNNVAGGNTNYYGTVAFASNPASVSGFSLDVTNADASVFTSLTTMGTIPTTNGDRRNILGVGPFSIPAGESVLVRFAIVGGTDLASITANAAAAQNEFPVAVEGGPGGLSLRLDAARPNPVGDVASITFSLADSRQTRLEVYDALGRRVAVLADGLLPAGEHPVSWDASNVPNGTYLLRLTAGGESVTRSVAVAR